MGPSWGSLGGLLGALEGFLGPSWRPSDTRGGGNNCAPPPREPQSGLLGRSWGALGPLLGALRAVLGASWAPLGAILGHLGAILRPQRRIGSEGAGRPKSLIFLRFWKDFGFLGGPRGDSESTWGRLVALLGPLGGMSEAMLQHLGPSWAILEAILEHWRPSWSHLGPSWALQRLAAPSVQVQGRG